MNDVRSILVSLHAVDQYRRRRNDTRQFHPVQEEIVAEVQKAIDAGRIANHKITGFVLYGEKRRMLSSRERFVWNEDETMAWILKRESDHDIVMTTLTRAGHHKRVSR